MNNFTIMEKELLKAFGQRIKNLRKQKGWSQEKLAEIADLHRNYIGMIERGERNPSLINISVLAKTFEVSLSELFNF